LATFFTKLSFDDSFLASIDHADARQVFPNADVILCDFHVKKGLIKQIIVKITGPDGPARRVTVF
jgi:hypothetical protein